MKEIKSFETELNLARELGREVIANDDNLAELIESQLSGVDDSYQTFQAGAQATYVCIVVDESVSPALTLVFLCPSLFHSHHL